MSEGRFLAQATLVGAVEAAPISARSMTAIGTQHGDGSVSALEA